MQYLPCPTNKSSDLPTAFLRSNFASHSELSKRSKEAKCHQLNTHPLFSRNKLVQCQPRASSADYGTLYQRQTGSTRQQFCIISWADPKFQVQYQQIISSVSADRFLCSPRGNDTTISRSQILSLWRQIEPPGSHEEIVSLITNSVFNKRKPVTGRAVTALVLQQPTKDSLTVSR